MKSILEIMAIGATAAALATAAHAGTGNNDAKVNVGTAMPAIVAPACPPQAASSPSGATKGSGDAKPACATVAGTSTAVPAAPPAAH